MKKNTEDRLYLTDNAHDTPCYSNLVIISHSREEFVLDFAKSLPGVQELVIADRVVMTPFHASKFLTAFIENMQHYEKSFGVIDKDTNKDTWTNIGGDNND